MKMSYTELLAHIKANYTEANTVDIFVDACQDDDLVPFFGQVDCDELFNDGEPFLFWLDGPGEEPTFASDAFNENDLLGFNYYLMG